MSSPSSNGSRISYVRWTCRLFAAWALASLAWGCNLLDPAEGHTAAIVPQLPYFVIIIAVATVISFLGVEERGRDRRRSPWSEYAPAVTGIVAFTAVVVVHGYRPWALVLLMPIVFPITRLSGARPLSSALHALVATAFIFGFLYFLPGVLPLTDWLVGVLVSQPVSWIVSLFGHHQVSAAGTIILASGRTITIDAIKSGWPFLFLLTASNVLYLQVLDRWFGWWRNLLIIALGWVALVGTSLWYVVTEPAQVFAIADTSVRLCWTTPLVIGLVAQLILWASLSSLPIGKRLRLYLPRAAAEQTWRRCIAATLTFAAACCCLFAYGVFNQGSLKVCVDEIHSRWEPFYGTYGREDIDRTFAENNYRSFLRWLSCHWDVELVVPAALHVPRLEEGVTVTRQEHVGPWLLEGSPERRVFIVKCVTKPYRNDELDVIEQFVKAGGRLFIVGEHTDVLFMNTNLNPLANRFGMHFPADSIYNLDGDWCVSSHLDLAIHPVNHFLDEFYWANGCTIRCTGPARPTVLSPWSSFTEDANYYVENFFGNKVVDRTDRLGRRVIAAVAEVGKGKVFAWTDSTCFNNDLFFTYGRRRLIKGILGWFSLRGLAFSSWMAVVLFITGLVLAHVRQRTIGGTVFVLLVTVPAGLVIGLVLAHGLNDRSMPEPMPLRRLPQRSVVDAAHDPRPTVIFEGRVRWQEQTFNLLPIIADLGRLSWFPEVHRRGPYTRALHDARLLVVAGPRRPFSPKEVEDIDAFVRGGGGLLLIEGALSNGAINSLASRFGLEFATGRFDLSAANTTLVNPTFVSGGIPLLTVQGMSVVSYAKIGAGVVLCFGDDYYFASENTDRLPLQLNRLFHDLARAIGHGDGAALEALPLHDTIVAGRPFE